MIAKEPQLADTTAPPASRHPLDPLSAEEITAAVAILRDAGRLGPRARFVTVELQEPPKVAVLAFQPEVPPAREAFAIVLDRADGRAYEAVVDLTAKTVRSWTHRPGAQPYFVWEELIEAAAAVRAHPAWQQAMQRRGITDLDAIYIEPQPAGYHGFADEEGRRVVRAVCYRKRNAEDNPYAHPIEGVIAVVDLNTGEVISVIDGDPLPIPAIDAPYDLERIGGPRPGLKPLEIRQPEGGSFTLHGRELHWQKWRMHIGMHPREGLVLHQIGYEDGSHVRPVCYRAALAEMVVPYGDPSVGQFWRTFFDGGEAGLGRWTNSLALGCDCLGEITYLDAVFIDDHGNPVTVQNAVCIHEEDFSVLWKHYDLFTKKTEVRRSRRLVVSFFTTIGNYDYGFYWYFYQDGSIELEVKLTGIVLTMAVADGVRPETATLLGPNLAAANHQHLFCFRLDLDVDGTANSVYEMATEPLPPGAANPYGNAFRSRSRLLAREQEAQRDVEPQSARYWKVVNPARRNAAGHPVGYALYPGETVPLMAQTQSSTAARAAFGRHQLWVTPQAEGERYPAGDYPMQHPGGAGLPAWTAANRTLDNQDVVLWYVVGVNHIVRPEDWPVLPCHRAGFMLRPWGFFDRSPALDVPRPTPQHAHAGDGEGCHCG